MKVKKMAAIEVGRVCVKTMGREAGKICVIVDVIDKKEKMQYKTHRAN